MFCIISSLNLPSKTSRNSSKKAQVFCWSELETTHYFVKCHVWYTYSLNLKLKTTVAGKGKRATTAQNISIRWNMLQFQKRCQFNNSKTHKNPKQIDFLAERERQQTTSLPNRGSSCLHSLSYTFQVCVLIIRFTQGSSVGLFYFDSDPQMLQLLLESNKKG